MGLRNDGKNRRWRAVRRRILQIWNTIKARSKILFDVIQRDKFRRGILQAIPFWVAAAITGVAAVIYARFFRLAEHGAIFLFEHYQWLPFIATPICFVFAWWLVRRFAPNARGSGIPQVMASVDLATPGTLHLVNKFLSLRIILIKVASSMLMVFGGGVIGREGPTIQIAGSIFNKINGILPAWWPKSSRRNSIVAGAAAGLSAAFNTPLGGIVFAIEELSKVHFSQFKTPLFTGVIIAGLAAQGLAGPYLYLGYPNLQNLTTSVFLGLTVVALTAGYAGGWMNKGILYMLDKSSSLRKKRREIFFVIGCALIIATTGFLFGYDALGSGKEVMERTLFTNEKYVEWYTPILRINGLIFSFTSGAAGGIFAPSLSIGASIGSVVSELLNYTGSNANLMILAGMVAFLTGVTHSPFTSAIIVLEMTDRHHVIFHLILAGMLANLATNIVGRRSIYEYLKLNYLNELRSEEMDNKDGGTAEIRK